MYMKGFNPKAYGTEKMMDYGFMTSMFKTEYFPVEDFWFAGENLNYYYFGQYVMTFLTKVSFTTVSYGYNLALGTGFAFCATLVYSLVCQIMKVFAAGRKKRISGAVSHIAGALAAVAVTIAGNGHYIVFNKLVPMLWDILQILERNQAIGSRIQRDISGTYPIRMTRPFMNFRLILLYWVTCMRMW